MNRSAATPCRVLILNERDPRHPKAGGAETHVSEIFSRLVGRGYEVTQLSSGFAGGAPVEEVAGVRVRRLGGLAQYYPSVPVQTWRETRRGEYDAVVECLNKVPFYSPVYSRAPVLALCHHLFGEVAFQQVAWPIAATVWATERLIPPLYRTRPFLAISESTQHDLVDRGIPSSNVRVSHPGIDRPLVPFCTKEPRDCKVVFVGRLEAYKKVDVMLRAMTRLAGEFPQAEITIIGRGPEQPALERLATELGLMDRTRFTGFVTIEERDRLLAEARVCVCPSEKEGWGLTVIESNAVGTPVVATNADGLRDSVRDGETGILVADEDVDAFATAIGGLLRDDAASIAMSQAAQVWSERFDWEVATDDMAETIALARRTAE